MSFWKRFRSQRDIERIAHEMVEMAKAEAAAKEEATISRPESSRKVCMRCNCPWFDCEHGTWSPDGYVLAVADSKEPRFRARGGRA
jgi:hypothetical protein